MVVFLWLIMVYGIEVWAYSCLLVTYFYAYVFGASFTIQVNSLILCNPYNPNRPIDMYPAYVIILTMISVAASIRCLRDISLSCEVISSRVFSYELKRRAILLVVGRYCVNLSNSKSEMLILKRFVTWVFFTWLSKYYLLILLHYFCTTICNRFYLIFSPVCRLLCVCLVRIVCLLLFLILLHSYLVRVVVRKLGLVSWR